MLILYIRGHGDRLFFADGAFVLRFDQGRVVDEYAHLQEIAPGILPLTGLHVVIDAPL